MDNMKNKLLYEKCKKIVKEWEFNFTATKGRVPSKLDIRDADKNIRDAYRIYFRLKTAALMDVIDFENELKDNIETNDINQPPDENEVQNLPGNINTDIQTWGTHLNKNLKEENEKNETKKAPKVLSSFTQKLFSNSKFMKRNPRSRSSLNISRNNSFSLEATTPETFSQPCTSTDNSNIENEMPMNFTLSVISDEKLSFSQPISLTEKVLNNRYSLATKHIDKGWLQRLSLNTGTSVIDEDMQITSENSAFSISVSNKIVDKEIISDSDEDDPLHIDKKRKLLNTSYKKLPSFSTSMSDISFKSEPSSVSSSFNNKIEKNSVSLQSVEKKLNSPEIKEVNNINEENSKGEKKLHSDPEFSPEKNVKETKSKKTKKVLKIEDSEESEEEYKPIKTKRNRRNTTKSKKTENVTSKENLGTGKRKRTVKETKSTRVVRKKRGTTESITNVEPDSENEKETQEYHLEYSIKPPPKTVPRIKKLPKNSTSDSLCHKSSTSEPTKSSLKEDKLKKKIQSGTLNDNFVRLDMKKKVFVKGKKHLNFSKFKKNQWKNKRKALYGPDMDMGGCDGGSLICFNCGKTGHFARQCKQPSDKLLPLEGNEEEVCPIPSLEEASEMAKNSQLAVFKPNISYKTEIEKCNDNTAEYELETQECNDEDKLEEDNHFERDDDIEKFISEVDISSIKALEPPKLNWEIILEEKLVKPVYELNSDGSLPDTPKEVFKTLSEFSHEAFRPGQEKAVMRILSGQSTLVTLSTGSGKSLCYQLPALLYSRHYNCISLVVSPLVSLMDDQVSGADSFLGAACLHASQTKNQREKVLKMIDAGLVKMLLLSPEAITAGEKASGFGAILRKLPPIAFACIDEAHCVSQWSHNFRPSYLMICHVLRERLGIKTILGLTATATHATCRSIVHHLQIPDGNEGIISDIPIPDNLHLQVSADLNREQALRELLSNKPYDTFQSIIVYCTRREECERIASFLRTSLRPPKQATSKYKSLNPIAEPYHAGLAASRRRTVQNAFMGGHLRIVVATVAFGMGINKSDIRAVIHYNMPSSFESYVQEVGRSGRDGLLSQCHVFLNHEGKDLFELKRHIYANSLDRYNIRRLLQKIFIPCSCVNICPKHEVAFSIEDTVQDLDIPEENISTLLCYLELHERKYVDVLTPVYVMCKVISYGGRGEMRKAAKDCAPLAMALALYPPSKNDEREQVYEFPVVDVAAAMGWDSGIVKHKLKNLEWITEKNQPKRSTLSIQFSSLGFRVRAPGNLPSHELDEALDTLYNKVTSQLDTSLKQLHAMHSTLTSVSAQTHRACSTENGIKLRAKIREYFSSENPLKDIKIVSIGDYSEEQIAADVRQLVVMYRDNKFNGRAVARIFHGIQSPKYPAVIWGRCRFWRQYLQVDFNIILQIATQEVQRMR